MVKEIQQLLYCIALGLVVGCTTTPPTHIALPPQVPPVLSSSEVFIVASQNEIIADVEKSKVTMYTGRGLIPALIDFAVNKHRSSTAEEQIVPVREALEN